LVDGYLILGAALLIIFYWLYSHFKTSRIIKQAEIAQREGRTRQSADLFIKAGKRARATQIALELPEAERTGIIQKLSKGISPSKQQTLFTKLGDKYVSAEDFLKAANAYELAGNIPRAARYFILASPRMVQRSIQLLVRLARTQKLNVESELRNLARFAFQHEKYLETAEILEFIGAHEEASAVLVYASEEFQKTEQVNGIIETYARTGKEDEAVALSLKNAQQMLEMNQLESALHYFKRAGEIAEAAKMSKDIKKAEKAFLATSQLIKARQHLKDNKYRIAADLYEKALAEFSGGFSEPLLAEAALAHEKSRNYDRAASLYEEAARRTSKEALAKRFREKSRNLKGKPVIKSTSSDEKKEEDQRCIICRRTFKNADKIVRCPHCHVPAHYAHFAEWIKINGKCPVCKNRLTRVELVQ